MIRHVSPSVRARLTLWYAGALAVTLCLFSVGIFVFVKARLDAVLDDQLNHDVATIQTVYRAEPWDLPELDQRIGISSFEVTDGGRLAYRTSGWPPGSSYRTRRSEENGLRISVARDESGLRATLRTLSRILLTGLPAAVGLSIVGGYVLAGRVLAPVGAMASMARRIGAESLTERLPIANPQDEFGQLASVFNAMLSRVQDSFDRLRRFTADASHELRTPLTAMRSVGEVALQRPMGGPQYREVIGSMLEEVDRLTHLVESLLTLTRAESGRLPMSRAVVDLGGLAATVVESLHVLADEKRQAMVLDVPSPVAARCDATILRQALVNVLHNAVKYTPEGGDIRIAVRAASPAATIEIIDSGPGIPAADLPRIFERFYRVDTARSRAPGGVGLGLAIARWAVEANGGHLEVESQEGRGALFRIVLPSLATGPTASSSVPPPAWVAGNRQ